MPTLPDLLLFALLTTGVATMLRPWRGLREDAAAAWPLAALALLLLWAAPAAELGPVQLRWSGSCLLVLVLGWPLATLTLVGVALVAACFGPDAWPQVLDQLVWQGLAPALLALALGWLVRHALPRHPFVYLFGRAFAGSAIVVGVCLLAQAMARPAPGLGSADLLVAHALFALGEGMLTGAVAAALLAMRPRCLATYSERLYLPAGERA